MQPIRQTCIPRPEVLAGDLTDALFAADFGHVIEGIAPAVYQEPVQFFRNTHPTRALRKIVQTVFERLANPNEPGAAMRLSTGFGGGKSHALITMWHLAHHMEQSTLGVELLPSAGRPVNVVVAGIEGDKFGSTVCATHGDIQTHALWTELAWQLAGPAGYQKLVAFDHPHNAPDARSFRDILPDAPVLILMDELVLYMAKLDEQGEKTLLAFINQLLSTFTSRPRSVLVITDPAGQAAYQVQAAALGQAMRQTQAATFLDQTLGRRTSDFDPIGDEAPQVINRRLFERVDAQAAHAAATEYYNTYKRVIESHPDLLPPEAATSDYANQQIVACYPFHPRLLMTAQDRLGPMPEYQKSRGTLRLFARILRDVWGSQSNMALITAGDIDWSSDRIQADLLQRLNRDQLKAAVSADIGRHAHQLDQQYTTDIHRRVAAALLLESLPLTPTSALERRELTLAVLRPTDVGHEPSEALDRLLNVAWYTCKDDAGRRFQFRVEANVNRLIEERAAEDHFYADARQAVLTYAQGYFKGIIFALSPWPASPQSVSDSAMLKLVLADNEDLAQAVCNYEDTSEPDLPRRRPFRNAIFAVAPSRAIFDDAIQINRRMLAAEAIADELRRQEVKKKNPLREQVEEALPIVRRRARFRTLRAFNRLLFQGRPSVTLDEKYLVPDENALETNLNGQAKLKQFLDDKGYVYQPNDALDVDLLLDNLVQGATPSVAHPGAVLASGVHERALSHDKVRLLLNEDAIRRAMLKAIEQGRLVVRLANGDAYDQAGRVHGPPGDRQRQEGHRLSTLSLTSDVLVAPSDAACVAGWLTIDEPPGIDEGEISLTEAAGRKFTTLAAVQEAIAAGQIYTVSHDGATWVVVDAHYSAWQPAPPKPDHVFTWDEAIEQARTRPLRRLSLRATKPDAARNLIALAQPFGAHTLNLTVQVGGHLKDGGTVNFSASNLKHNHALKPIDRAAELHRAMTDSASFSAALELAFDGGGLPAADNRLQQAKAAGGAIEISAEFGEEPTTNA